MTVESQSFRLGVIEGFFGLPWSWQERTGYASFLGKHGFGFYIYAPKADNKLRKLWREPWSVSDWSALRELRSHYAEHGVEFGLGLTPYELQRGYTAEGARDLARKIDEINALEPDILAILFDDIPHIVSELAAVQTAIVSDALAVSTARTHFVCPTYYSDDPVLTTALGAPPGDYLQDFGRLLAPEVEIFWTGLKVCSGEYTQAHLRDITSRLGRKPFIWDNYPVNDGPRMCKHLHLRATRGRSALLTDSAGVAANPMNQALLSKIPLLTLAKSFANPASYEPNPAFENAANEVCGPKLAKCLSADLQAFHDDGQTTFNSAELIGYTDKYRNFDTPISREIVSWLEGRYEPSAELLVEFEEFAQQQDPS